MSGMEQTNSEDLLNRGSIKFPWKEALLIVVFCVFSWFDSLYGLFDNSWINETSVWFVSQAGIEAIANDNLGSTLNFQTSLFWLPAGMVHDALVLKQIDHRFDLGIGFDFLPGFQEIQDNGVAGSAFPFGLVLTPGMRILDGQMIYLDLSGFVGFERVNDFYSSYPLGVKARFQINLQDILDIGFLAAYANDGMFKLEIALARNFGVLTLTPAVEINDFRVNLKMAGRVSFGKSFVLMTGVQHTLSYEKTQGSFGFIIKNINLLGMHTDLSFVSTLNQLLQVGVGLGMTFHFAEPTESKSDVSTWY